MARPLITAAIAGALAFSGAMTAGDVSATEKPGARRRKRQRVIADTERGAIEKRERKNALRLKQSFHVHKPTNHPGREFVGCDERRRELADRKEILLEGSATAARLRHRPDKPIAGRVPGVSRRERRAGKGA
ncbi:hypothetical protein MAUB1S_11419 [Mycolicibacterium aubagnense]